MLNRVGLLMVVFLTASSGWAQCSLLSWEEYNRARHSFPYVLRLNSQRGALLLFGARHTSDPRDPQLAQIESMWREFKPDIAFSEGGVRPPASSRDDAVTRYGEPGLLRFLSDRDRVAIRTLEPPEQEEAAALVARFGEGRVKLFYVLRGLAGSGADRRPIEDRVRSELNYVQERRRLTGSPRSIKALAELASQSLPDWKGWSAVSAEWFDPTKSTTFLNEIARLASEYRNCHMVPLMLQAVTEGKRVFVVVGGSHVIVQEQALRQALNSH